MHGFHTSVMLALLPTTTEWCKIELPHLTLVYAGQIQDLKLSDHNELAKAALSLATTCEEFSLKVTGVDIFGDDEDGKVDVLRLENTPGLSAMRSVVEMWNASKHSFNPHVTVGPVGSLGDTIPMLISFDKIMVAWGYDNLTYRLRERTIGGPNE